MNSSNNNQINNNDIYSLHNVSNYNITMNYNINEILNKLKLLIIEYLKLFNEKVNLKNTEYNKFILIRGMETVSNVFNQILYYSKNMDMAFYHGQKAFYFYVEFIEQITDDQHTFLQLNSRDASMFVYKKTLFDVNNEFRKNISSYKYTEQFDILHTYTNIMKNIISILMHNYDYDYSNEDKKSYLNNIINKSENIFEKINSYKHNKTSFNIILKFIEQLNKNISFEKYIEIIELFIKKYYKGKVIEIKLQERLNNFEFYEKLEDTPLNFISWIFS